MIYYFPLYVLIILIALYGIVSTIFPRWIARWDFHYNERDNPSSLYSVKMQNYGDCSPSSYNFPTRFVVCYILPLIGLLSASRAFPIFSGLHPILHTCL